MFSFTVFIFFNLSVCEGKHRSVFLCLYENGYMCVCDMYTCMCADVCDTDTHV